MLQMLRGVDAAENVEQTYGDGGPRRRHQRPVSDSFVAQRHEAAVCIDGLNA